MDLDEGAVQRHRDHGYRGLFMYEFERSRDRLIIRIFTSRPIPGDDLRERLHLSDNAGTEYTIATIDPELVDGKGVLEITPAPPVDLTWFKIADGGAGTFWVRSKEPPCE